MIILDENFPESQRQLLQGWRISFKQIGFELGQGGMKDDEIIPLLHQLNKPTFFTLDDDFFKYNLCHSEYCLIFLDVVQYEASTFVRRTLNHTDFNTKAKRMGNVIRVAPRGLTIWKQHSKEKKQFSWSQN